LPFGDEDGDSGDLSSNYREEENSYEEEDEELDETVDDQPASLSQEIVTSPPDSVACNDAPGQEDGRPKSNKRETASGAKAKPPPTYAIFPLKSFPDFISFVRAPCSGCIGGLREMVEEPGYPPFRALSFRVTMRCGQCSSENTFHLASSPTTSRNWCLSILASGMTYSHLDNFCSFFGLPNLCSSQFYVIQGFIGVATKAVVEERRDKWVTKFRDRKFRVLTDARHASFINSDHNTTTMILLDLDDPEKLHHLFTFDVPREEAPDKMAASTDPIGVRKGFTWIQKNKLQVKEVSSDDCSNTFSTLEPFRQQHHLDFQEFWASFKDSWHKGKKLSPKMEAVWKEVWALFQSDPVGQTTHFQNVMSEVMITKRIFSVSPILKEALDGVAKAKVDAQKAKKKVAADEIQQTTIRIMEGGDCERERVVREEEERERAEVLEKERLRQMVELSRNDTSLTCEILKAALSYYGKTKTGKKKNLIDRLFQTGDTIPVPKSILIEAVQKKVAEKEKKACPTPLAQAEANLKNVLELEKKAVWAQLFDKGSRLSPHFHASSTRCNGGTAETLRGYLLNCLDHWAGIHTRCLNFTCTSEPYSSRVLLTHVVAFMTLYRVFTSKGHTDMTLEALKFYTKDVPTSLCESFHSYLMYWAPKKVHFGGSYETRILMAELCWNDNLERLKRELPPRQEPDKGKRARGSSRSTWKSPMNFQWVRDIEQKFAELYE
jgi:hypothetical protein